MSRPWMPLYIADYLADTTHLRALESGAYLHLIFHYWQHGALPQDDRKLSAIAKLSDREWNRLKPTLAEFFGDGWTHKRIDAELAKSAEISSKRSAIAKQRHSKSNAIAEQLHTHARAITTTVTEKDAAPAASVDQEVDLFRRGKEVLGKTSGGLIKQLLTAKGGKITDARAAIETAAGKQNPREYIGGVIRKREQAEGPQWLDGIPGVL